MPQTGKYTAADLAPAQQQGTYSAADIATPDTSQQPPNSFLGGVGRRLSSMVPTAPQTISEGLKNVPWLGPIPQALMGVAQNIKQLGPQLVQQAKQGQASHQPGDILPNLNDARTAVTAASMLNPFAAGSVANVNQLQDEGRGSEAAGQGLTDAALLAAGGAASRVIPKVAGTLQDYTPSGNIPKLLGRELTGRLPFLSRFDAFRKPTFSEYADALKPDPQMSLFRNTPKMGDAVQQPAPAQVQEQPPAQQLPFLKPNAPPAPESPPVASPVDPKQFYGKTSGKSNLKANQRQLASPTGSTAPNPGVPSPAQAPHPENIMKILNTPGDISDADMQTLQNYFAKTRLQNMLGNAAMQKAAGQ